MKKIILFTTILLLCVSCNFFTRKQQGQKIAEVNDKILLLSDVNDILPAGISPEDSLRLLRSYVNNWARKQLMADLANQFLTKEQKDVSREIEDYRLSLLVFRYEKLYIEQRLNTSVSEAEITNLYKESAQNFILMKPIAKAVLIKITENLPQVKRVRQIYRSMQTSDRQEISQIGVTVTEKFTNFDDQWIDADFLANELPMDAKQVEAEWAKGFINIQADGYEYFVHLYDIMQSGEQSPIGYERATISSIIRNRRKQEALKNLEDAIFNDALNNKLKIYIDK